MKKLAMTMVLCTVLLCSGCESKEARESYEKGAAALEEQNYEEAADEFQVVVDLGEKLPESYRGLGIAQLNLGKYAEASIALSKSLVELDDENLDFEKDVNSYLAVSRTRRGEYEEAIRIYGDLLQLEENPEYYFLRGKCYLELQDSDSAKEDFDKAASASTDYNLFLNIYQAYDNLQMNADGSAYLEQALELVSETDYYSRGLIYYYLQDYSKAKDNLIQAIKEEENASAILLLGKVYLSMDDVANARAMFQEYTENDEVAAQAYNGLALCDMAEENYDTALINIEKGLEYDNEDANQSLLFNQICAYEYMQEWDSAREKSAEYITKYPTDEAGARENAFLTH